jgi:hypothetical protein
VGFTTATADLSNEPIVGIASIVGVGISSVKRRRRC